MFDDTRERFVPVTNETGSASLWPAAKSMPPGWSALGPAGNPDAALALIAALPHAAVAPPRRGGRTLVELVDDVAAQRPDRIALTDDQMSLTYQEMVDVSVVLAGRLVDRGVGTGCRVVIHRDRGAGVFVAMLAVLRAGAAYVAVDTRYPDARRDLMVTASEPALVITQPGWGARLESCGVPILEWDDRERPVPTGRPGHGPADPGAPASVLFTSGSTGSPKAIVLSHDNLVGFAVNPGLPALTPEDRVGQVSSISFDAINFEVWSCFAAGAELVVIPSLADSLTLDLQRELRRRRITAMLAPTMAVNHVVFDDQDAFAPLRVLTTGGDVLQVEASKQLLDGSFAGTFHNLYGPAEATTACTAYHVDRIESGQRSVPIGRPLSDCTVHLLDGNGDPVADGGTGEIHIGGRGVAIGYLGQPVLTAERFLPDPFGVPGSRMYRTGDLARRRDDGVLEFVGRLDDQVKVRGYRVEPREVERSITAHAAVREAAVVTLGDGDDRHLVAVIAIGSDIALGDLRQHTTRVLPDYMVPSAFVVVPAIPSTSHGKRDIGAIRALAREHVQRRTGLQPPEGELEEYLAQLWEGLLTVESVGRDDDFFALGGNSLLAFRMQRRIRRDLDVRVDVQKVMSTSRLSELAELIAGAQEVTA